MEYEDTLENDFDSFEDENSSGVEQLLKFFQTRRLSDETLNRMLINIFNYRRTDVENLSEKRKWETVYKLAFSGDYDAMMMLSELRECCY